MDRLGHVLGREPAREGRGQAEGPAARKRRPVDRGPGAAEVAGVCSTGHGGIDDHKVGGRAEGCGLGQPAARGGERVGHLGLTTPLASRSIVDRLAEALAADRLPLDLPPAITVVAQTLMTLVFGFIGLMVAVPLTSALLVPLRMIAEREHAREQELLTHHKRQPTMPPPPDGPPPT
jgi:hypothetical protein